MAKYNYSIKKDENLVFAVGRDLSISSKHSIEICSYIRKKPLKRVKAFLSNVVEKKEAVPFKRFNGDVGHRAGMGAGRFPVKAASEILSVIKSAESNAKSKNMDLDLLYVYHCSAQRAATPMRYGRHSRRESKRTHVEIALKEHKKAVKEAKKWSREKLLLTNLKNFK